MLLDPLIPKPGDRPGAFDVVIASQPYRARMPVEFKAERVLSPLARSLAPGGRMIAIQSRDDLDATSDVVHTYGGLWFHDESFVVSRKRA